MHQLTIEHRRGSVSVSSHADFRAAHRALLRYVVHADYYLFALRHPSAQAAYALLDLGDATAEARRRDPAVAGTATITELPAA